MQSIYPEFSSSERPYPNGGFQRISELHPSYDPLYYVLLFPRDNDSWHADILLTGAIKRERNQSSLRTELYNGIVDAIHASDGSNNVDASWCKWKLQKTSTNVIGRLYIVQLSEGKRYYLRTLLTCVKRATSFNSLKIVDSYQCSSFKEACICLGLLQNDAEWNAYLLETSEIKAGQQL
ncbi:2167_t:CDS:2 [Diversispora eburnea]|uniref:2167_t:CDS:1 n=1 Tax=Diversispora eburnea TaxID=1213867 RepID=A0A9N8YUF5_9GLOM|nr:2167_t:CDS:2 [Diversispora eburnea]